MDGVKDLIRPEISPLTDVIPFHYCIKVKKRKAFMNFLLKNKIQTGIHWIPLHFFKYFEKFSKYSDLKVTQKIGREIVTLPLHSKMQITKLKYITEVIKKFSL